MSGRGHFSHEQALLFCSHFKLSEEESEFFIDLLNRDRAGTSEASLHFQRIINRKILERRSFQKRNKLQSVLKENQEVKYLASWIPSAVYGAVHISELQTAKKIGDYLNLETRVAEEIREVILRNLTDIRKKMVSAPSEQLFVLCLDFYPIYSQYVDQECKKF